MNSSNTEVALREDGTVRSADEIITTDSGNSTVSISIELGEGAESGGGSGVYTKGDSVTLSANPHDGYTFLGWFDSKSNLISISPVFTFVAKEDKLFKAEFAIKIDSPNDNPTATPDPTNPPAIHYTVSYSPSEGFGSMPTDTVMAGTSFTLPSCAFTPPAGKQFKAWLINGKEYNPGVAYLFTADTTVTAVWQTKETDPGDYKNIVLPFSDVADTAWYIYPVKYAYATHLMNGYSSTTFGPGHSLTRAQFAQIIYNLEGKPETGSKSGFSDVPAKAWYFDAVNWAADKGMVAGYGGGIFAPEKPVTREQIAVMLYRYVVGDEMRTETSALKKFRDAKQISSWAESAMAWAVEQKIISGMGNGKLAPKVTATRAEIATVFYNYLEKNR